MKVEQKKWDEKETWQTINSNINGAKIDLILVFGDRTLLNDLERFKELKKFYPTAHIVSASTSGNILGTNLDDHSIVSTAYAFERPDSKIEIHRGNIADTNDSAMAGEQLSKKFTKEKLKHIFLISDGHLVNGSKLVEGFLKNIPHDVSVTGGLAGDGTNFHKTVVGLNLSPREGEIVAIGFYGEHLKFGFGSYGGWDPFGVERKITKSLDNVLYELDGKSALELYKTYLGDQAKDLPGSALLFPLAIRKDRNSSAIVRTILSINESDQSMTFAGNLPQGWYAQLMKANFDRLIDGSTKAAENTYESIGKKSPDSAILISCVGRRLVLDQRSEEEIERVKEVIGNRPFITGFYSYGEISPSSSKEPCQLHNQTMTITTITEE